MRLLLDTNVLIDYFSRREPFFEDCVTLRIMQVFGDAELWVSAESFADAFCVLKKPIGSEKLQQMFVESREFFNVCSIDGDDIQKAANREWSDFEDSLISVCADKIKADCLITRDKKRFDNASVHVKSPSEFFIWLEASKSLVYDSVEL